MPEKIPVGKSVRFGIDIILERPELAAQASNVCSNWALIEWDIMELYSILMGAYLPNIQGFNVPNHPVAYQVFDTLNSFRSRSDLLLAISKWIANKDISEKLERDIIPKLASRHKERSVIAHAVWAICDDYPEALILRNIFGGDLIYKLHDFKQVSKRISELRERLSSEIVIPVRESFHHKE